MVCSKRGMGPLLVCGLSRLPPVLVRSPRDDRVRPNSAATAAGLTLPARRNAGSARHSSGLRAAFDERDGGLHAASVKDAKRLVVEAVVLVEERLDLGE